MKAHIYDLYIDNKAPITMTVNVPKDIKVGEVTNYLDNIIAEETGKQHKDYSVAFKLAE